MPKRLYRSHDRILGGVAAGMADYFGLDVALVRLLWVIGVLVTSVVPGLVAYAVAWIIIPEAPHPPAAGPRGPDRPNGAGAGPGASTSGGSPEGSRGHSPRPDNGDAAPEAPAGEAGASGEGAPAAGEHSPDPAAPGSPAPPDRPARADGGRTLAALVLIAVGAFSLLNRVLPWFNWDLIWPLALIVVGAYLLMGRGTIGR